MFRAALDGIRERVPGAIAVGIIDLDGIAVDEVHADDFPLEIWSAEIGAFAKSLTLSVNDLDTGLLQEFGLVTERYTAILSSVTSDYFILMVISPRASYGRARYEIMKARHLLRDELS